MTARYVLSPRAQSDLEAIWDHTERQWGLDQAEQYLRQIWQGIEIVAAKPLVGRDCSELRASYRKYRTGAHVLFYRVTGEIIDVVRILHERMDFERHL